MKSNATNGSEEHPDVVQIIRDAGGPQNLTPVATVQVFLLSVMLREERKEEGNNDTSTN
jgi:hypothetical protein